MLQVSQALSWISRKEALPYCLEKPLIHCLRLLEALWWSRIMTEWKQLLCCSCACGEELAVGCSNGGVVLLDRSLHVLRTIAAFEGNVVAMQYLEVSIAILTPARCRSMPTQQP